MCKEEKPNSEAKQETEANQDTTTIDAPIPKGDRETNQSTGKAQDIRESGGAFISSALWVIFDFKFVWPDSHKEFVIWLTIWAIFQCIEQTWLLPSLRRMTVSIVVSAVFGIVLYWRMPPTPPKETETHFWLEPADDPVPNDNACAHSVEIGAVPKDAIFLHIGGIVYWIGHDEVTEVALVGIHYQPVIWFSRKGDQITIGGNVLNVDGDVVAHIQNDEVHLIPATYGWVNRKESDRSTFQLFGSKGQELLYMRFANPTTIRLRAILPIPDKSKMAQWAINVPYDINDAAISPGTIVSISDLRIVWHDHGNGTISSNCTHVFPRHGVLNFGN